MPKTHSEDPTRRYHLLRTDARVSVAMEKPLLSFYSSWIKSNLRRMWPLHNVFMKSLNSWTVTFADFSQNSASLPRASDLSETKFSFFGSNWSRLRCLRKRWRVRMMVRRVRRTVGQTRISWWLKPMTLWMYAKRFMMACLPKTTAEERVPLLRLETITSSGVRTKLGAHNKCTFQNDFVHTLCTSFQIDTSLGKMLHKRNVMRTQALQN